MTDFRALCAELLEALENAIRVIYNEDGTKHISTADPVIAKADAALAQPEPVDRPTWTEGICGDGAAILKDGVMQPIESVIAALNAAELTQPEPQGPTDEDIEAAARSIYGSMRFDRIGYTEPWVERGNSFAQDEARRCARAVLTRWGRPAIKPVPQQGE
jgi:hypothetical protein